MFSHELDMLEGRLYEGKGIVDRHFIGESGYTHRGHKKPKFAALTLHSRFKDFSNLIQIVDLDTEDCPSYIDTILKYREMNPRPKNIWDTQTAAQECLAAAVRRYAAEHSPEALVQVSDLDEIPLRHTLVAVKQCDLPPSTSFPVAFSTAYESLGKLCRPPQPHIVPGMLFKAIEMTSQRRHRQIIATYISKVEFL